MSEQPESVESGEVAGDGEAQDQPDQAVEQLADDGADAGAEQAE